MSRHWLIFGGFILLLTLFLNTTPDDTLHAQDDTCPEIVEFALASVNNYCSNINRNSACYGYNQVDATFNITVPELYFTQASDIAPLLNLETLQTASLNPTGDIWGLAVMNIQANLPDTLPGQSVVILLMGDAEIQNEVDAETAFTPGETISITTLAPASNIRTAPTISAPVSASVPSGTAFETDGRSPDGEWLRIIFDGHPAWISRILVNQDGDLDALAIIESDQYTPMQAFRFRTGIGQPVCSRAPDSIMIQGPENIDVTINANGADITIGSTIVLKTPTENRMQLLSVSGSAIIDGVVVPGGFTVFTELDTNSQAISGTLSGFRPLSDQELEELGVLEDVNPDMLQYPISVPTRTQIINLQNVISKRENALAECRASENLTLQQCLQIIGNDGDLVNRLQRCLDSQIADEVCHSIISGNLNAGVIIRCLAEGYRSEEACMDAYQDENTNSFEDYCQQENITSLEACQLAAESLLQSSYCTASGAFSPEACFEICQSQGYTTLEECHAAVVETIESTQDSTPDNSTPTVAEQVSNFCQSIGASTAQECVQICVSNGYTTPSECRNNMGG